ncbi:Shikimate kinase [Candidatus Sulfotelmatobacter sp. SbA7]|nr:Shikimate kinase [Candidatus Sulfotelmatobacter sp. SbA7]
MPQADSHKVVFLVGFMGAGKTSVGRSLSRRLGWDFEDLDDRIQARARRPITEIFRDLGESEFRRLENAALRELLSEPGVGPRIVALGGGAFAQPENAALLERAGAPVIFLDGPAEELFRRCQQEQRERPLLRDAKQFHQLYEQRRASYLKAACRIDTAGKDVDGVAAEVACRIGLE